MNDDPKEYAGAVAKGATEATWEFFWPKLMKFIFRVNYIEIIVTTNDGIVKKDEIVVFSSRKGQKKEDAKGKLKCGKCQIYYFFRKHKISPVTKRVLSNAYICRSCDDKYIEDAHNKIIDIARVKWIKNKQNS